MGKVDMVGDVLGIPVGGSVGLPLGSIDGCAVSVGMLEGVLLG